MIVTINLPCEPSGWSPSRTQSGAEAQAVSTEDHEVWALFFNTWPLPPGEAVRIPVNEEVKIVWRSTGEGTFRIEADGPEGASIEPVWGPDLHGSSTWKRPGQERAPAGSSRRLDAGPSTSPAVIEPRRWWSRSSPLTCQPPPIGNSTLPRRSDARHVSVGRDER